MSPLVLVAALAVGASLPLLGWALVSGRSAGGRGSAVANLALGLEVVGPTGRRRTTTGPGLAFRLTPRAQVARLERLLAQAGRPAAWPLGRLVGAKLVLAVTAGVLGLLFLGSSPGVFHALVVVVAVVVCHVLPELLLHSRGHERRQVIGTELADTLDQMTIAVEAGLGFEAAMQRSAHAGTGPLAEELRRTLQDMQMGQPRRTAYVALAERSNVPDLRRFVRAVVQADQYGVAIADVLRTQAAEMRLKRRQRAEEKAMQVPVKVIFPLLLCILPCLFIVLLGPAVMGIVAAFSH